MVVIATELPPAPEYVENLCFWQFCWVYYLENWWSTIILVGTCQFDLILPKWQITCHPCVLLMVKGHTLVKEYVPYCIGIWAHNGAKWWCLAQSNSYDPSYKTKQCMSGGTHITGANIPGIHTEKLRPFITVAMETNCTLNAYNSLKHT